MEKRVFQHSFSQLYNIHYQLCYVILTLISSLFTSLQQTMTTSVQSSWPQLFQAASRLTFHTYSLGLSAPLFNTLPPIHTCFFIFRLYLWPSQDSFRNSPPSLSRSLPGSPWTPYQRSVLSSSSQYFLRAFSPRMKNLSLHNKALATVSDALISSDFFSKWFTSFFFLF